MSDKTAISWCDSTVNFWQGCTKVSPACDNCYAERRNRWLHKGENWGPGAPRLLHITAEDTVRSWQRNAEKFRKAHGRDRRVFVNSTSDWLDNEVPIDWLVTLLDTVRQSPDVTFLLLSKRIGNWRKRMDVALARVVETEGSDSKLAQWIQAWLAGSPPAHAWLGATICNQTEADRDIPKLLAVPAAVRFLSIEPMLGRVDLCERFGIWWNQTTGAWVHDGRRSGIDWVIPGGESGLNARPSHPDWFRSLRDQCAAAGVPFHFKQWGEWAPGENIERQRGTVDAAFLYDYEWIIHRSNAAADYGHIDDRPDVYRVGTKAAGRLLDGRTHDEFPR